MLKGKRKKGMKSGGQSSQPPSLRTEASKDDDSQQPSAVTAVGVVRKTAKEERKLVYHFVKKTLEKGPLGLRKEFMDMKRGNNLEKMKVFVEMNAEGKNRYKDVGCLDESRVKLVDYPNGDYIHANFVQTPASSKRFICTQAPLEKTCADFWMMCMQERVDHIIMLCNFTEKGAKKCYEYFPTSDSPNLKFDDFSITYRSGKTMKFTCDTTAKIRETTMEVEYNGKTRKTKHYHWIDWPDRGVPPADMAVIQLLDKIKSTKNPIVVHCSAGIGRTGSVVLIQSILESLNAGQEVESCDKLLIKLREQRNNSVQTDHQYLFVHMVMLNYFLENKLLDSGAQPHIEKFYKEYKKVVI